MRSLIGRAGVAAVAGGGVLAAVAGAGRGEGAPGQGPAKGPSAGEARFPGAELTSVEKETEEGKVVYDIELKHHGRKYEMDIHEDGTVIEIEKVVAAKDVPQAVTKGVLAKYPGARITEVMEVNKVKV